MAKTREHVADGEEYKNLLARNGLSQRGFAREIKLCERMSRAYAMGEVATPLKIKLLLKLMLEVKELREQVVQLTERVTELESKPAPKSEVNLDRVESLIEAVAAKLLHSIEHQVREKGVKTPKHIDGFSPGDRVALKSGGHGFIVDVLDNGSLIIAKNDREAFAVHPGDCAKISKPKLIKSKIREKLPLKPDRR